MPIFYKMTHIHLSKQQSFVYVATAMTHSLPNMDNCGHLVSPLPPLLVHVVIECLVVLSLQVML